MNNMGFFMFSFYFNQDVDGKYRASIRIEVDGKLYGTYIDVDDGQADTVAEAYTLLLEEAEDIRAALHEQEN
jgi:hypothetical protein